MVNDAEKRLREREDASKNGVVYVSGNATITKVAEAAE